MYKSTRRLETLSQHLSCTFSWEEYTTRPLRIPYSWKLLREKKLEWISRFCSYLQNFSPIGGVASFGCDTSEQSVKVFSTKILFPPNRKSFPPRKFPLESSCYMVVYSTIFYDFVKKLTFFTMHLSRVLMWSLLWDTYVSTLWTGNWGTFWWVNGSRLLVWSV